jgi:hypothetical protein
MFEFANDGGPLMLAPRSPAPLWEGSAHPSGDRVVEAVFRWAAPVAPATDYDRACDVEEGAALLSAGEGWVIVLNSEIAGAGWLPLSEAPSSAALVAVAGGFDESLAEIYERLATGQWVILTNELQIGAGGVFLMHAAGVPGLEHEVAYNDANRRYAAIGDAIVYPFPPGTYRAEMSEHVQRRTPNTPGTYAVFLRLTRVGEIRLAAG